MRIAITLDDVIRAKTKQIFKIYNKFINQDKDTSEIELTTNDYQKLLGFKDKKEFQKFLYEDYPFEIFAEAEVVEKMLDKKLNLWHIALGEYDEPIELILTNPFEFNASIGFTYFFLSKTATRIREVFLPLDSSDIWKVCDVLVTADPKLIENKDEDKVLVKIEMDYNKELESDYTYKSLSDFISDDKIIDELISKVNND